MNLDITTLSKSKTGREQILKDIINNANSINRENELSCWDMYNNKFNESDYDYLRKFGDYVIPAYVRHIPKQRPYVEFLTSKQTERTFQFSITAIDKRSLKKKLENKASFYLKQYKQRYDAIYNNLRSKIEEIDLQRQMIQQQLQKQPQTQQEQEALMQAQMAMPRINAQIETLRGSFEDAIIFTEKDIKKLDRYQKYNNREFIEEVAQKATKAYRQKLNIKQKSIQNFISHIVTGKQYWYVNYRPGDENVTMKPIPSHSVFYQAADDVLWVEELGWAGFKEMLPPHAVIAEFGNSLTQEQKDSINSVNHYSATDVSGPFVATQDGKVVDMGNLPVSSGSGRSEAGVEVKRVFWVSERRIKATQKPNKYRKGKYFTNFFDSGVNIIDEKDYYFNNKIGKWINKDDKNKLYPSDEVKTYDSRKGDLYHERVLYDRYYGVVINNSIFLSGLDEVQPRGYDHMSDVLLPIIGPTFNNITFQPYSLIWSSKDIQKLINLVSYHREVMLAVAGTKAVIMDKVQKPEGMSDDEWRYNLKMGDMWIETRKKGVGQLQPTYNQFQVMDLSLSSSIQYFDNILENLDNQMGLIMGITRQAMGQTTKTDQVGTFQLSQQSTLLITEVLYYRHDEIERRALNMMLNLARQFLWDKETILSYINDEGDSEIIQIPSGVLNMADYEIVAQHNTLEERKLNELKGFALQNFSRGQLSMDQFFSLYNTNSLMELEKKSSYFAEETIRLQNEARQAEGAQLEAIEEKKIRLKAEMDAMLQDHGNKMAEINAQMVKQKQDLEGQLKQIELGLENKKIEQEKYLKVLELVNEKESEDNAIMSNERQMNIDARIRLIQTQLQAIQMSLDKDSADKKINVDKEKVNKQVREHVSDR